ncbi:MAG: metallophosphoesterase [Candidatus Micrarchaeaceae archaeon]
MPKMLVVSDLHYPTPYSSRLWGIIKEEKPNAIVLLGDVIDNTGSGKSVISLYREFIGKYRRNFPLNKSAIILGDNDGRLPDYSENAEAAGFLMELGLLNRDPFTYRYKNMFFFHGNIEDSFIKERIGYLAGKVAVKISKKLMPYLLVKIVRYKFALGSGIIPFLGHLHYLGIAGGGVMCGTLHRRKILYGRDSSLGYVTIAYGNGRISMGNIKLIKLGGRNNQQL